MIFIKYTDRDKLLEALWNESRIHNTTTPIVFDLKMAYKDLVDKYPNFVCGRLIKADIYREKDYVDPSEYDEANGEGKFEEIMEKMIRDNHEKYLSSKIDRNNNFDRWKSNKLEALENTRRLRGLRIHDDY
jgi:hypothetical protein